jgi:hypothetical protein
VTTVASPGETEPRRGLQEVLLTVLLVVAAVATSWSSYQATRWNGEQARAAGRTTAIRIDAARSASLAQTQSQIDVATFIAWTDADRSGEPELATFYQNRFRPEFEPAFAAWMATEPFEDADAPPTPFAMPEYRVAAREEAERLDAEAAVSSVLVSTNIQRSSNYVLSAVLYAVVLFFAGMSTRLRSRRLRWVMTAVGCLVLVATVAWVATFPVSIAI